MWSKTEKMWSKLTITVYEDNYSLWGLVQRVRVLGSLWKPHQSKELFFPFRYRYPELFPTPPKFGDSSVWSRERGSELRNCGFQHHVLQRETSTEPSSLRKSSSEPCSRLQTNLSLSSGGVGRSSGYLYRKEKSSSFDWHGFQSDPSTLCPHKL